MRLGKAGFFVATLSLAFLLEPALAQNGAIRGKVTDSDGNPIKDVLVRIEGMNVNRKYKVKTNKKGEYIHIGINLQGLYRVIAEKEGYQPDYISGFKPAFDRGDPGAIVDFTLNEGQARKLAFEMSEEELAAAKKRQEDNEKNAKRNADLQNAFNLGVEAFNASDFETAILNFSKATEVAPDEPNAWANLARSYARSDQHEKAVASYEKAIELNPSDAAYYQNLGTSYAALGQGEKATESYNKSAEISGGADPKAAAASYYNLAVTHINSGRNADAREALEKAIEADPGHSEAHYQLGIVMLGVGDVPAAIQNLKRYLELSPDGPNAAVAQDLVNSLGQ